ncbi:MAG: methylenetetrahydrofolate reductase C-terminal domain-containing protein [Promethearchaeota archaeon]
MIITKQKPLAQLLEFIKPYKRILITGCDGCYQPPRSEKEAEILGLMLRLKDKIDLISADGGRKLTKAITILRQCDDRIAATSIKPIMKDFQPEAIITMACGIGVQILSGILDVPVFPGQDTMFLGAEVHEKNEFVELCRACGDCVLGETGGVCPVANCAKHLMNGPCGGTIGGMCEVGNYTRPCAWIEIWKKLKKLGRMDLFKKFRMPRDYRVGGSPRSMNVKDAIPVEMEGSEGEAVGELEKEAATVE